MSAERPARELPFLADGGEMGARIRAYPWGVTAVGAPTTWPPCLRSAIDICLSSTVPTAIYWGPELRLLYNDAWAPIPGERHPWALGRPAREVWAEIWQIIEPQFAHVLARGEGITVYDYMLPMQRNGRIEETYWNYSFAPIRNEEGKVLGVFNQGHEVTAKVLSERSRTNEVQHWHELFQQAPGAIAVLRGPQHIYEFANQAYLDLIGRKDIIGRRLSDVLPEAAEHGFVAILDRVYRTGKPHVGNTEPIGIKGPGGTVDERMLDYVYQPIRDAAGEVTGIFAQATDVTEKARAEAALRRSEERLRKLNERLEALVAERTEDLTATLNTLQSIVNRLRTTFETSFIFQGYLSPDGTVLEANAESLAAIEATLDDVAGKPFWQTPWFTATSGMSRLIEQAVQTVAAGESIRRTIRIRLPTGERTFDFSMRPVRNAQGDVIGIVPEGVDLTPLLHTEERLRQSQKMEAVGQLTGGIAHDFNNLLTGIIGSLDMMQRRIAQERYDRVADYVQAAITSANRAAALTHRLLAFARRQPLDPKPVAANALISEMEDLLHRTLGEKIRLTIRTGGDLWLTRCDPNQLESSLLNLVINARDALPNGGQITIETHNAAMDERAVPPLQGLEPGQYVCICVTDDGVGMSTEVLAKAFDPFFTTKPVGQGTGLGLSMVYGFVRQSGGYISIDSKPQTGTAVKLYLPRFRGDAPAAELEAGTTGSFRSLQSRSVLIVEDESVVRDLIADALAELGYRVLEAQDGKSGLEILRSGEDIDLLISDVGLPELNGRHMAELAREYRPKLKVLFITGYAEGNLSGAERLEPGMQLIRKPFSMEILAQRVQEMIGQSTP